MRKWKTINLMSYQVYWTFQMTTPTQCFTTRYFDVWECIYSTHTGAYRGLVKECFLIFWNNILPNLGTVGTSALCLRMLLDFMKNSLPNLGTVGTSALCLTSIASWWKVLKRRECLEAANYLFCQNSENPVYPILMNSAKVPGVSLVLA